MQDSPEDEGWPDPGLAERLLDGEEIAEPDPRTAALARLLAAADATVAGRPDDERAALRAFAREFAGAGTGSTRPRRLRALVRGSRTARVMIGGAVAALTLGGVAIAAQSGALPHPFHSRGDGGAPSEPPAMTSSAPRTSVPRTSVGTPAAPGTHGPTPTATGTVRPTRVPSSGPASPPAYATGAPDTAGMKGLCTSYANAERQGRKLDTPAQARLARAAGGASEVDAYCARLTGTAVVHGKPSADPRPSASKGSAGSGGSKGSSGSGGAKGVSGSGGTKGASGASGSSSGHPHPQTQPSS
jgi:uncharacterized membrane protein YgcG